MDPASIAAATIAILSPFAKQAGEELVKTVGEVAVQKMKSLFTWLKQRFTGDAAATKDLTRFETDPDKFKPGLEETLVEKMQSDPAFLAELKLQIEELEPVLVVMQTVKDGTSAVGVEADELRSGKVAVTQNAERVDFVTGVKAKIIG